MRRKTCLIWTCLGFVSLMLAVGCQHQQSLAEQHLKKNDLHQCTIDKADELCLVKNGKANVEIVVFRESSGVVMYAAKELRYFLNKATGADIKIVPKRTGAIPAIILGDNKWTKALGVEVDGLPRDGFKIKRVADVIVIAGKDAPFAKPEKALKGGIWAQFYQRATLFGVYEFLEKFVGVRFYFPGDVGTVVPFNKTLMVPAMDISDAPDFPQRKVSYYSGEWFGQKHKKGRFYLPNMETYRLRGETKYVPNCHGLSRLGIAHRYADSNPNYFALLSNGKRDNDLSLPGHRGHLCYANPKLENEIYKDAEAFLTEKPASIRKIKHKYGVSWDPSGFLPGYFNIMPQDGHGKNTFCHCSACWSYYGNNRAGELVWCFVTNIARRLKKNNIPGYVTAMAYGPYRSVPKIEIPENVLVMLAVVGPWAEHTPKLQKNYDQLILDWNKKIAPHKVWLWTYANKYGPRNIKGTPNVTPRCVGSYFKRVAPHITGAYMESETDQFLFNYLNWYVFYKVAWNNSTDVEELLKEHHEKMFGPGASAMGEFYDMLETLFLRTLGKTVDTDLGPVGIPPSEHTIWEDIYSQSVIDKMNALFGQAEAAAVNSPEHLKRIVFIRRNLFGKLLEAHHNYFDRKKEIQDLVFDITPTTENIRIDGNIGNEWKRAANINLIPFKADKAHVKTTVYGCWDQDNLYLAMDCKEPKVGNLSYIKRKKDDPLIWQDASVEVFLNPSGDRKNYYQIIVNPAGSISDQKIIVDSIGKKTMDWKWNGGVEAISRILKDGWQVEMKIPLKKLGITNMNSGIEIVTNFCRSRNLKKVTRSENQLYTWSPYLTKGFHQLERFGSIRCVKKKPIVAQ